MQYEYYGHRELVRLVEVLEEKLTQAYEELGMPRTDAQACTEAVIMKAN
jgi:hypothetical protein